jgi:hypothetical protein
MSRYQGVKFFLLGRARLGAKQLTSRRITALSSAFIPGSQAVSVKASASGIEGLVENPRHHYAPDQVQADIVYDNGVTATLTCGPDAPAVDGAHKINHHKRIAVKGTEGELLWSMWGWQLTGREGESSGRHDYFEEDILGQAAMVESMINWMEDDADVMPLCLGKALADFEIVMGMYQSVIHNKTIEFPLQPEPDILGKIRKRLG